MPDPGGTSSIMQTVTAHGSSSVPSMIHTRRNPVFVVGYARSGTSLMCRLLRYQLGINFGSESQFIVRYHRRLARYGDLHEETNIKRLIDDISRERFFSRTHHNFGFVLSRQQVLADLTERTYPAVLRAIFDQFTAGQRMVRWGDKTPEYSRHLPLILDLFPDAQFVHVVRDGRDAALSIFKTPFGPKNAYMAALEWQRSVRAITDFGATQPPDRFLQVHYERLLAAPVSTLVAIAAFLGIEDPDGQLATLVQPSVMSYVRQDNVEKWRRGLSASEQERFDAMAGDLLAALGYSIRQPRSRPIRGPEAVYWRLHNRWRQLHRGGYWLDTWYRARLRLRELAPRSG